MPALAFGRAAYERAQYGLPTIECVNLYPERSPSDGKEGVSLLPTPGQVGFSTVGSGGIRGIFWQDGVLGSTSCLIATVNELYSVTSGGVATKIGDLDPYTTGIRVAGDDDEAIIVTGSTAYRTDGTTTETLLADIVDVAYLNSRFLLITADGKLKYSAVTDGSSIAALDFVTAESAPDGLKAVLVLNGEVYLIGAETTEIWNNTTSAANPFQRRPGGVIPFGTASRDSCIIGPDKNIWMVGNDRKVYRISPGGIEPVENPTIGGMIEEVAEIDLPAIRAWGYSTAGHRFLGLDLPGVATMVYDIDAGAWAKRQTFGETLWTGFAVAKAFGKVLIGARSSGAVRALSDATFTDAGGTVERMATAIAAVPERTPVDSVTVYARHGVGNSNVTSPQLMLSCSKDGGRTFGTESMRGLGVVGAYNTRTIWRRFGRAKQDGILFKLRVTDPCSAVFMAATYD